MADPFEQGLRVFVEQRLIMERLLSARHITRTEVDAICVSGRRPTTLHLAQALESGAVERRFGRVGGFVLTNEAKLRAELAHVNEVAQGTAKILGLTFDEACARAAGELAGAEANLAPPIAAGTPSSGPAEAHASYVSDGWEAATIAYLAGRYDAELLASFLPEVYAESLRKWRVQYLQLNDYGTATEMAEAMVVHYERDLLRDCTPLRDRLAEDNGIPLLKRFWPGGHSARKFVSDCGLPAELAGDPEPERPPALVRLGRRVKLGGLVAYQKTLKGVIEPVLAQGLRAMASLPTGAGKTRVAVEALLAFLTKLASDEGAGGVSNAIAVWVAHSRELCEQACRSIEDVWLSAEEAPPMHLARLWGRNSAETKAALAQAVLPAQGGVIVVTSPPTLLNLLANEDPAALGAPLRQALLERCRALVIDEAHRGAAPTYRRTAELLYREGHCALLGLTATPYRATYSRSGGVNETLELMEIFGTLLEIAGLPKDPRHWLIRNRWLAHLNFEEIETGVRLKLSHRVEQLIQRKKGRPLKPGQEAMVDRELCERAASNAERAMAVFEYLVRIAQDPNARVLYFAASVFDAERMTYLLRQRGIPAAVISARTREGVRRRYVEQLKTGEIRVLCNKEVLTTGFDEPKLTHVVVARPTMSLVLYEQMIGRGLRGERFGGTPECTIVNCVDRMQLMLLVLAHVKFREGWEEAARAAAEGESVEGGGEYIE